MYVIVFWKGLFFLEDNAQVHYQACNAVTHSHISTSKLEPISKEIQHAYLVHI
jgi:hypothetical protein